jgi:high-affinity nickel-transport protein
MTGSLRAGSLRVMPGRSKRTLLLIAGGVLFLNVAGWGLYLSYARSLPAGAAYVGVGVIAYVLGIRHAFDADHIAAIDDSARLMVNNGRRPFGLGFFFALGHSAVVLILCVVVALAAGALSSQRMQLFQDVGGRIGTFAAATFLLVVAAFNFKVLKQLLRTNRGLRDGSLTDADAMAQMRQGGPMSRMLGPLLTRNLRSSWQMMPIGFIFGLGLETASEVALLSLSAEAAASGALPFGALIALPLLFAAGMSLFDTIDSIAMVHVYASTADATQQRIGLNVVMTAITAAIATVIGLVYLAEVFVREAGITALAPVASLSSHFEAFGYVIVSIYAVVWASAFVVIRRATRTNSPAATAHLNPTSVP